MATIRGVDVSAFQGQPAQWTGLAGSFAFGAVKLTELGPGGATYTNPDAAADWAWLRANGKARVAYLFGHPSVPAAKTVSFFAGEVSRVGLADTDAVAVDLETTDGLAAAKVAAWAADVLAELHFRYGRTPLLYTFLDFARGGNCAGLGGYPLWISDPSSPAGRPTVPPPWKDWAIHQYVTVGDIDRDVAQYASAAAMCAALGKSVEKPAGPDLQEDPMLVLTGANADTPIALPDGARSVRLASVGETTVNIEFAGAAVHAGVRLSWDRSPSFSVPAGSHVLRVFRPADGSPGVPVSVAVS